MKLHSTCFIASVLVVSVFVFDFTEAQVTHYATLDDFLLNLKATATSLLHYVTMMQALMCPNQPLCGADGELERNAVLEALPPALTVGNLTVILEDIPKYIGVCCLHCSCSDSCREDDNCCPTKQMLFGDNKPSDAMRQECRVASLRGHAVEQSFRDHTYLMVGKCLTDNDNQTLIANCERPDIDNVETNVPVTSLMTGNIYRNMACATCNYDTYYVVEWLQNIIIKAQIPYFTNITAVTGFTLPFPDTHERLRLFLRSTRRSNLIYTPPEGISTEEKVCIPKGSYHALYCEIPPNTELPPNTEMPPNTQKPSNTEIPTNGVEASSPMDFLYEACRHIVDPVRLLDGDIYTNVFCFLCRRKPSLKPTNQHCKYDIEMKSPKGYLTALLNYKAERDTTNSHVHKRQLVENACNCAEIFDPFLKHCRPLLCPAGEIRGGCRCISLLTYVTGMPFMLKVKMTANSNTTAQLSGAQIRKLNKALKNSLEAAAMNTTAEIYNTFQQGNASCLTYLSVVIVESDPKLDIKSTMNPFMRYLDTGEKLDLSVGKLNFSAVLTTKAIIWTEFVNPDFVFKTCCLDQDLNDLDPVYTNKDVTAMRVERYQALSRLLYCNRVELNATEYTMSPDKVTVTINVTEPAVTISNYHSVSPTQIHICADAYIQKSKDKKTTNGSFRMGPYAKLLGLSLISTVFLGLGYMYA